MTEKFDHRLVVDIISRRSHNIPVTQEEIDYVDRCIDQMKLFYESLKDWGGEDYKQWRNKFK